MKGDSAVCPVRGAGWAAEGEAARVVLLLALAVPGAAQEAWIPTSTAGAPSPRYAHTAVWTGSRMIVWGGMNESAYSRLNTGGIYDPATNNWTRTSTTNAPLARHFHTAVWTGSKMIVWGGYNPMTGALDTGGIYDPVTDTWTATSTTNAPEARSFHTAVWTGSRMIVWGGGGLSTGGIYDAATDTWTATSMVNAPMARRDHRAVWTGSKMIVWGGEGGSPLDTGGIYDPATDAWTATSTTNAPVARYGATAVWTGSRMIIWGGHRSSYLDTGGIYDPATDTWTPTSTTDAPVARNAHTAVWTGSRMIVWGGLDGHAVLDTGGIYDPATDTWTATSTTAASSRGDHTAVWAGSKMIVWGGGGGESALDTGGVYSNPAVLPPPSPTAFFTVTPCRVFDTRESTGPTLGAPLACGAPLSVTVVGKCGVPPGATAVSSNLTGTESTAQGNLRLFASGTPAPQVSSLNYAAGQTRANNAVAPLGADGQIAVLCSPTGTTHVVLDVNGYFAVDQ